MPKINVSEIINDQDFAEDYKVYRKSGSWVDGRWAPTEKAINFYGVVTAAGNKDIIQVPEGDRTSQVMCFHATKELYVTNSKGTSDEILWRGKRYRIHLIKEWADFGYYKALATLMESD